jgi:hypothetical protein
VCEEDDRDADPPQQQGHVLESSEHRFQLPGR